MRYRIKKITRNNGTETYIPQVKEYSFGWWVSLVEQGDSMALWHIKYHQNENQGKKIKKVEIINII